MFIIERLKPQKKLSKKSQTITYFLIATLILILFFSLFFLHHPLKRVFLFFLGIVVFLLAFTDTNFSLIILLFSMLLSPEFSFGEAGGRAVIVRIDDIFLIVIFLGWLARMATTKEIGLIKATPLNPAIYLYVVVYIFATFFGIIRGFVSFKNSIFYLLKYFEYFMLYFMVVNVVVEKKQVFNFVYIILVVALIVSLYAWRQHFLGIERVAAPFEEKEVEANTLGGYLVLINLLAISLFLNISSLRQKIFLATVIFFSTFALLFTLSRGSWLAFIVGYLTIFFVSKRGKFKFLTITAILMFLFFLLMPQTVLERAKYTFTPETQRVIFGKKVNLDASASARIDNWFYSLQIWSQYPIIGKGAGGGRYVVDNQYGRVLLETGLLGILAFLFLVFMLFKVYNFSRKKIDDELASGLSTALIAILVAFLFHSLSCETFIVIRIMEPFWFLTALVAVLPEIFLKNLDYEEAIY